MKTRRLFLNLFFVFVVWLLFQSQPALAFKCANPRPDKAPDLFQIDVTKKSAKLYFSPVNNAITGYTVVYGTERNREDFGVSFPFGQTEGVVDYTINDLLPNTTYYFKVRADNGCRAGKWSNSMRVETNMDFKKYFKVKPSPSQHSVLNLKAARFPTIDSATDNSVVKKTLTLKPTLKPKPIEIVTYNKKPNFIDFINYIFSEVKSFFIK